jgi:carbamoyltransferase
MKILGISCYYHDAAAALVEDGIPIAMAQEERFTRCKHDPSFPKNAIDFILKKSKTGSKDIDYIVFYEKPFLKFERFIVSTLSFFPHTAKVFREGILSWVKKNIWIKTYISENLNISEERILFIPHHLSHAASSFFCSPFDAAAILTVDGVGEWTCTAMGFGQGSEIVLTRELRFPHSLGLLYSVFTGYLGFKVNDGEYKLMGLAPYGKPRYFDKVKSLMDIKDDGSFRLNLDYFSFHKSTEFPYNHKFLQLFGEPRDAKMGHLFDQRHADIAASIQKLTEDVLVKQVTSLCRETGFTDLCIAGGVGLNSVANYKILKNTPIENIFVQPAAGDAGGALGAALYVYYSLLNNKRKYVMEHAYYGQSFTRNEIKEFLDSNNISYEEYSENEISNHVAEGLEKGKIFGWFQGPAEWGPRALGNRSILADARRKEMLKTVNLRVKFRESFRPFAPSVMYEDTDLFFDLPKDHYPSRFMLYVCPVTEKTRSKAILPAITHVDGSARPQVVMKELSPSYYKLLEKFKERTGIGCFLNTSFNLGGKPIVNSPEDAYKSFMRCQIDELILDNLLVKRVAI